MNEKFTIGRMYPSTPVLPSRRPVNTNSPASSEQTGGKNFADMLQDNLVRLSHHAEERLQQRGIDLNKEQLAKINSAIDKAAQKGAKDSLMLMNDVALIVNIRNKTVVTAMDTDSIKDNVFTKIDSAVIIS